MSTLKVGTIQDTSAGSSSTPAQIMNGRAKAWVKWNGTGTLAINGSYNVSTVTDNGTGDYQVNFTTAFANANYTANFQGDDATIGGTGHPTPYIFRDSGDFMTTSYTNVVWFYVNNSNTRVDVDLCCGIFFG